jgi:hypothetical protein
MALPNSPNNRREVYLSNIAGQGTALPSEPITREEEYLDYIARNGGGGGGGEGDMTKAVYDDDLAVATEGGIKAYVASAISDKVDKVSGKGLSSNDYDDSAKAIVDGVTTALDGKVSKSNTAGLLKNDGTVDTTSYATAASVTAIKDGQSIDSFGDVETALADKVSKSSTAGLLKNDGTVDTTTTSAVSANTSAISAIKDGTTIDSFGDVEAALSSKANLSITYPTFNEHLNYYPGNTVIYDGEIYTFITNHNANFPWDSSEVTHETLKDIIAHRQPSTGFDDDDFTEDLTIGEYFHVDVSLNKSTVPTSGDTKPITSGAVYDAVTANTQLIKETVGWSGKNKIVYPYVFNSAEVSGVTFTVKRDGTILINGTATSNAGVTFHFREGYQEVGNYDTHPILLNRGDYIISKQDTSVGLEVIDTVNSARHTILELGANQSEGSFTISNDNTQIGLVIRITNGQVINNLVFKPMIRKATITDPTYEPYFGSTAFPRSEQAVLGAKNLITIDGTSSGIFTINSDKTVTVNGNGGSEIVLSTYKAIPSWLGDCYLSGGTSVDKRLVIGFRNASDIWLGDINNTSGDTKITIPTNAAKYQIKLVIGSGITLDNEVFYPMVSFDGGTYAFPAMTNRELTDNVVKMLKNTYTGTFGNSTSFTFNVPENSNIHTIFLAIVSEAESLSPSVFVGYKISNVLGNITKVIGTDTAVFDTSTGKFTITSSVAYRSVLIISNGVITV